MLCARHADAGAVLVTGLQGDLFRVAPYTHAYEGPDDMPAHLKALLVGSSVTIPVSGGQLATQAPANQAGSPAFVCERGR